MGGLGWNFDPGSGRRRVRRGDSYRWTARPLGIGASATRPVGAPSGFAQRRTQGAFLYRSLDPGHESVDPVGLARYRRRPKPGDHTEPR